MKHEKREPRTYTEFTDGNGTLVSVERAHPCTAHQRRVWILAGRCGYPTGCSPCLTPAEAKRVAKALLDFARGKD